MAWRKDGQGHYAKSRTVPVERAIPWAWRTITDEVPRDKRTTFVPYSQNSEGLSRWGCIDFDAHDGDFARAQRFAFDAWKFLLNTELTLILESTGGGWHVWCVAKEFRPVRNWSLLLRGVAKAIGAPVRAGICEVFPDDTGARHGKGVRAPGSWNPTIDSLNLIFWENSQPLLSTLKSPISKPGASPEVRFTNTKSNDLSLYPEWDQRWKRAFAIEEKSTRHQKLLELVGAAFHKIGRNEARKLVEAQYAEANVTMQASQSRHLREFEQMWDDLFQKWVVELSEPEREKLRVLKTESERDAFRIIRNFARIARERSVDDFPIALSSLASRLGFTPQGAAKLLRRFAENGILRRTAYAVIYKAAARYAWKAFDTSVEGLIL